TIVHEYDLQGRKKRSILYGPEGEKTLSNRGVAGWSNQYDSVGNFIKQSYFGLDGQPILNSSGYAGWSDEYDVRGNHIKRSYFGINGEPIVASFGYAGRTQKFDKRDNEIERRYFGLQGELVLNQDDTPFALRKREYNKHGQLLVEWIFDANGAAIEIEPGVYAYRHRYDKNGAEVEKVPVTSPLEIPHSD
ncbi:MAG: hypothetical protein AAF992_11865, partial [Bacteroidota bacterium]